MVKILVILMFAFIPLEGYSEQFSAKIWVNSLSRQQIDQGRIRVLFASKLDLAALLSEEETPFDSVDLGDYGIFQLIANLDVRWGVSLNRNLLALQPIHSTVTMVDRILDVTSGDIVVLAPESSNTWTALGKVGRSTQVLFRTKAPDSPDDEVDIYNWLSKSLGYEGAVIDVRGDYLLVLGGRELFEKGVQALVLANSSEQVIVPRRNRKGIALIQLVSRLGNFGVFKVLLTQSGEMPVPGSKVSIEGEID